MRQEIQEISRIYTQQIFLLIDQAHQIHKANFKADVELCQIISVKTGGCPEDCGYCAQSNKHDTQIKFNPLLPVNEVEAQIKTAKSHGVKRICLAAGYKTPDGRALNKICEYIATIKQHGLESCATLGSLSLDQANQLKAAGLDYYNHNIDTSPEYYPQVITTRTFQDRVATLFNVGKVGMKVCCGVILGLGETRADRLSAIQALTDLHYTPDSIPVNTLVQIPGTPLANTPKLDKFELVRTIATMRILFPTSKIRLSAGRSELSELEQLLCFMAGANSIHYGEKLLTTPNNEKNADQILLNKLGMGNHAVMA